MFRPLLELMGAQRRRDVLIVDAPAGIVPVVRPEPRARPRSGLCSSWFLGIGAGLLGLILVGIAGGWLWLRRRQ